MLLVAAFAAPARADNWWDNIFPLGDVAPPPSVPTEPAPLLGVGQLPERPPPLVELGSGFLSTGPLTPGFELPGGAVWQPRLWVFGDMTTAVQSFSTGTGQHVNEWANRLDLYGNLQLTGTERILIGLQPLNHDESGGYSGWRFNSNTGPGGGQNFTNGNIRTLFLEGDLGSTFPDLDRKGLLPLDFGYTIGRQPLTYQNGELINDSVTAVGLVRNSIHLPYTSNVLISGFYGWDHVQRANRPIIPGQAQPTMEGIDSSTEALSSTFNVDVMRVNDISTYGSTLYVGAADVTAVDLFSSTQLNTTLRVNSSIPDGKETAVSTSGTLVSLESSFNPHSSDDLVYFNPYLAIGNFTQAAVDPVNPGPLGGLGILYAAYGIGTAISPLNSAANNAVGFALGYEAFWDRHKRSLTLEYGLRDQTAHADFTAQGVGARFQQSFAARWLAEIDTTYTWQENHHNAYGARTQLTYQF
jgi:hypothetical protein